MNHRNTINDELKSLNSGLPVGGAEMPYSVPDGYFDGIAAAVMARIKSSTLSAAEEIAQLSPLLAGISRTMPYSVPDQYFSDNLESLYAVVAEEPELSLPGTAGKAMPYTLPEGYFEGLGSQVIQRVEEKPTARVVPMAGRRWMRWAAAAMIGGVMAISGIAYFNQKPKQADVPVSSPQWVATKLNNVSDKEIDEFVRAADVTASSSVKAGHSAKISEVKQLLKGVSQKDLDAFLDQVPEDEELAIN